MRDKFRETTCGPLSSLIAWFWVTFVGNILLCSTLWPLICCADSRLNSDFCPISVSSLSRKSCALFAMGWKAESSNWGTCFLPELYMINGLDPEFSLRYSWPPFSGFLPLFLISLPQSLSFSCLSSYIIFFSNSLWPSARLALWNFVSSVRESIFSWAS